MSGVRCVFVIKPYFIFFVSMFVSQNKSYHIWLKNLYGMNFYPKKKKNGYWACIDKSPRIQIWYNNIYIYIYIYMMLRKLQENKHVAFWMEKETKHVNFWMKTLNPWEVPWVHKVIGSWNPPKRNRQSLYFFFFGKLHCPRGYSMFK